MITLFFSYAHRDEELRDELEINLATLKRQGVIDTWHDRRIVAGENLDHVTSAQLEAADIILLLVSPYFIASDYAYDIEMKRALERHQSGTARVIPVILHPCEWRELPFGKLMATPFDGKPISTFPNQHDAFLQVAKAIRKAAEEMNGKLPKSPSQIRAPEHTHLEGQTIPKVTSASSNYGVFPSLSNEWRQRCVEAFGLFDELRTPDDLRAFTDTTELRFVRKCVPHSASIVFDRLISCLQNSGNEQSALLDLLAELASRYRGELKGRICESLIEDLIRDIK